MKESDAWVRMTFLRMARFDKRLGFELTALRFDDRLQFCRPGLFNDARNRTSDITEIIGGILKRLGLRIRTTTN